MYSESITDLNILLFSSIFILIFLIIACLSINTVLGSAEQCVSLSGIAEEVEDLFDNPKNNWGILKGPHWATVNDETPVVVEGIVDYSRVTHEDYPFDHITHDSNFGVKVDPTYQPLVQKGPGNEQGEMEMEWETKGFPSDFWPEPGDRVWMMGRYVFDCGHNPLKTEIHPPQAVAFTRPNQIMIIQNSPYKFSKTYVYIHGRGGYYSTPVGGKDYTFDIPLPPRPSNNAFPYAIALNSPYGNIRPLLTPVTTGDSTKIQVVFPLSNVAPSPDNKFGAIIGTGWVGPGLSQKFHRLSVTFDNIKINNYHDPPECKETLLFHISCSGWKIWASVNGVWTDLLGGDISNLKSSSTHQVNPFGISKRIVVDVPDDASLKIQTTGWDSDAIDNHFGESIGSCSLTCLQAIDQNDPIGVISNDGFSGHEKTFTLAQNFGVGSHDELSVMDQALDPGGARDETSGDFNSRYTISSLPVPVLDTNVQPQPIMARKPTSVTVQAFDHLSGNRVSGGEVFINNVEVGSTNTPFTYTFSSSMVGTVKASSYLDAPVYFGVLNLLSVSANPNTIELHKPVQVTISANDPVTHALIAGKVMSNEFVPGIGGSQQHQIGTANTQFTHTFSQLFRPRTGVIPPTITVIAPGYDSTKVNINFTGLEPPEPP